MRPMMLISVMVSAPYSSLSAAKRFSLESPEDTHRARQAADYRGGKPPEALHSARVHKHTHTLKGNHTFTHLYRQTHTHTCCIKTQSQAHHKNGATRLHLYYLQCVPTLCTRSSTHTMYWLSLAKLTLSDSITGMHSKVLRVFNMWLHI